MFVPPGIALPHKHIMVIGGRHGTSAHSDVEILDLSPVEAKVCAKPQDYPLEVRGIAAGFLDGGDGRGDEVLACGGRDFSNDIKDQV